MSFMQQYLAGLIKVYATEEKVSAAEKAVNEFIRENKRETFPKLGAKLNHALIREYPEMIITGHCYGRIFQNKKLKGWRVGYEWTEDFTNGREDVSTKTIYFGNGKSCNTERNNCDFEAEFIAKSDWAFTLGADDVNFYLIKAGEGGLPSHMNPQKLTEDDVESMFIAYLRQ